MSALVLLVELVVLFFGVAFAIQLLQRRLGGERVKAWMGGSALTSALKGIAIGFVTPFCTYSAIPMLVGLRHAGVPPAGYVAFLTAAPILDPVLFGALVIIAGLEAALVYSAIAFVAAISLAVVAQHVGIERRLKPLPSELTPNTCGTAADSDWLGLRVESAAAARAARALVRSVGPLLIAGVLVGVLIESQVSPDTVARITGDNSGWSIPAAAALGTPLYVQTSLFVPIADSLRAAGVGMGAIVALTIAGAGANVPELVMLTKLASVRLIAGFFVAIFAVALSGGLVAEALLA